MMDQLELRLTKLTMVSLAKSVWNNTKIKNRISDSVRKDSVTRWNEDVMPDVLRYSISITKELPKKLRTELEEVIVFIGEEICSWIKVLTETLRLDFIFAETIYLTPFGAIDEWQIMEKYWLPNVEKLLFGFNLHFMSRGLNFRMEIRNRRRYKKLIFLW